MLYFHVLPAAPPSSVASAASVSLSQVILKFTTVTDGNEPPSFAVGTDGATVGRGSCNDISIPTDQSMVESDHASIVWKENAFHLQVRGGGDGLEGCNDMNKRGMLSMYPVYRLSEGMLSSPRTKKVVARLLTPRRGGGGLESPRASILLIRSLDFTRVLTFPT